MDIFGYLLVEIRWYVQRYRIYRWARRTLAYVQIYMRRHMPMNIDMFVFMHELVQTYMIEYYDSTQEVSPTSARFSQLGDHLRVFRFCGQVCFGLFAPF